MFKVGKSKMFYKYMLVLQLLLSDDVRMVLRPWGRSLSPLSKRGCRMVFCLAQEAAEIAADGCVNSAAFWQEIWGLGLF